MRSVDFRALIDAPEKLVVDFFKLFEIEDRINFDNYRTKELNSFHLLESWKWWDVEGQAVYPTLEVYDISPIKFDETYEKKLAT